MITDKSVTDDRRATERYQMKNQKSGSRVIQSSPSAGVSTPHAGIKEELYRGTAGPPAELVKDGDDWNELKTGPG